VTVKIVPTRRQSIRLNELDGVTEVLRLDRLISLIASALENQGDERHV
jgi:hypothetical protein